MGVSVLRIRRGYDGGNGLSVVFTGGLWLPVYLYKWVKATGAVRETSHT